MPFRDSFRSENTHTLHQQMRYIVYQLKQVMGVYTVHINKSKTAFATHTVATADLTKQEKTVNIMSPKTFTKQPGVKFSHAIEDGHQESTDCLLFDSFVSFPSLSVSFVIRPFINLYILSVAVTIGELPMWSSR